MICLAFDTSTKTASVAILNDRNVLYDVVLNTGDNHSATLMPLIDEALGRVGLGIRDMDVFCYTSGPGSFTGLRIGLGTLRGLTLATSKPAYGVSALTALAMNAPGPNLTIRPLMDAGRGQVYTALFRRDENGRLSLLERESVLDHSCIADHESGAVLILGDGAVKYSDILMKDNHYILDSNPIHHVIHASSVGILGMEKYQLNDPSEAENGLPIYLRSSDAQMTGK